MRFHSLAKILLGFLALLIAVGLGISFKLDGPVWARAGDPQRSAGVMTVFNRSFTAFETPAEGLNKAELDRHIETDPLFEESHVPLVGHLGAGLGPTHNAKSCASCHILNGRGKPIAGQSLFRVAMRDGGGVEPVPGIGFQLQDKAIYGHRPEANVERVWMEEGGLRRLQSRFSRPDGKDLTNETVARSLRIAPPMIGMGLLEAIPESDLLAHADPDDQDGDGISGRPVWVEDHDGKRRMGRFGWKAISASVLQQSANAYRDDMGLTTATGPDSEIAADGKPADISWEKLDGVTYYTQTLGAPATAKKASSSVVSRGSILFDQLQCASCHVPSQRTGINPGAVAMALNEQRIWPYTDLLLHDMGPGLDDGVAEEGLSLSSEWRTAPLWGLGMAKRVNRKVGFLHDGRARTVEEAILWHGGEAAQSRQNYENLSNKKKRQLLAWLDQL
ncbi:MAG: di-heme oxidoredictase family protein [Prochlorococcus sp.]